MSSLYELLARDRRRTKRYSSSGYRKKKKKKQVDILAELMQSRFEMPAQSKRSTPVPKKHPIDSVLSMFSSKGTTPYVTTPAKPKPKERDNSIQALGRRAQQTINAVTSFPETAQKAFYVDTKRRHDAFSAALKLGERKNFPKSFNSPQDAADFENSLIKKKKKMSPWELKEYIEKKGFQSGASEIKKRPAYKKSVDKSASVSPFDFISQLGKDVANAYGGKTQKPIKGKGARALMSTKEAGEHKWSKSPVMNLGMDIATDPTMYIGAGFLKAGVKGASKIPAARRVIEKSSTLQKQIAKSNSLADKLA